MWTPQASTPVRLLKRLSFFSLLLSTTSMQTMEPQNNLFILSRCTRQIALLDAELQRSQQIRLLRLLLPSCFHQEVLGSAVLGTPSVEPAPTHPTPRYGPIGSERVQRYQSSEVHQMLVPPLPFVLSPNPRLPPRVPILEALFGAWDSPRTINAIANEDPGGARFTPPPSFTDAFERDHSDELPLLQADFTAHGVPQAAAEFSVPDHTGQSLSSSDRTPRPSITVPLFRPLPRRSVHTKPPPPHPSPLPSVSLFNCIELQLNQLDGTQLAQRRVWEQLRVLSLPRRFSEAIPTLVECLVDQGITRGSPLNVHIADFCGHLVDNTSVSATGTGDRSLIGSSERDIRSAFLKTFKESWTPPPKLGSLSFKFLKRMAFFYGHLYLNGVLGEDDFKECVKFLSELSPLPLEGLRALLSGDIEEHKLRPV